MGNVLLESLEDGLLTLTLNRPDNRNALNEALCERLLESVQRAAEDSAIRAVILQGSGKHFCVGGDVKSMGTKYEAAPSYHQRVASLRRRMEVSRLLHEMPKPTLALITGAA